MAQSPGRLAAVLAAAPRRPVSTGTAIPGEITRNPELMGTILASLNAGDGEQTCKMAMRWCAAQKGMCDDERLWQELRVHCFPKTGNALQPVWVKNSEKSWFYMLCHGLEAALAKQTETELNLVTARNKHVNGTILVVWAGYNPDGSNRWLYIVNNQLRDLQFERDLARKKLQWIMMGRHRKGLVYARGDTRTPVQQVLPRPEVLTDEEIAEQLKALEAQDRERDGL